MSRPLASIVSVSCSNSTTAKGCPYGFTAVRSTVPASSVTASDVDFTRSPASGNVTTDHRRDDAPVGGEVRSSGHRRTHTRRDRSLPPRRTHGHTGHSTPSRRPHSVRVVSLGVVETDGTRKTDRRRVRAMPAVTPRAPLRIVVPLSSHRLRQRHRPTSRSTSRPTIGQLIVCWPAAVSTGCTQPHAEHGTASRIGVVLLVGVRLVIESEP